MYDDKGTGAPRMNGIGFGERSLDRRPECYAVDVLGWRLEVGSLTFGPKRLGIRSRRCRKASAGLRA